ncbi:hypothetical protein ACFE04_023003 [Oxalis oulophora]
MMLSASPDSMAKSSLEEMLESLWRREESQKPKDLPPALPARPISRAPRLPSARKSLPVDFRIPVDEHCCSMVVSEIIKGKANVKRKELRSLGNKNSFGSKKLPRVLETIEESPYVDEEKKTTVEEAGTVPKVEEEEGKWNDNIDYFIKKKLRVWCRLQIGQWELGRVQSTSGGEASVLLSSKNVVKVPTEELVPANPDILKGVEDLIHLTYLNEPSVLYNLGYRYTRNLIYVSTMDEVMPHESHANGVSFLCGFHSKAGSVLIAVNPFKEVKIYGNDFIRAYKQRDTDSPHVYATADHAYNEMMQNGVNQSIIISGESGTGKTETAKFAMQYLAALGGGSGGIEHEILHSNCILEAFGNAKTSRNDNSSRFIVIAIKYLVTDSTPLFYVKSNTLSGTDLLEKSRVVQLNRGERSYHIFYQLCSGAPSTLRERLNLKVPSDYNYLNQSECLKIDGVDDAKKFRQLVKALEIVKVSKEDQEHAFSLLAAVLWLGNISFHVIDNENHVEVLEDEAFNTTASLMGCGAQELKLSLSTRKIYAGRDRIAKKLTLQQAIDTRDALAKFIYASLFDFLIEKVNESLAVGKECTGRSINIVDIYGFESFKKNSFEQFCINYANERLQQHFIRHLFKLEQEDYETDGIDWTKVDFEDNDECLNLFEKKPLGLISLLDEESNFPKATDLTFADKVEQHLSQNTCFKGERGTAFTVSHYAGQVIYDTSGFLEKNRDPVHSDLIELLLSCTSQFLQLFASQVSNRSRARDSKQTVGTKFKGQLFKLMYQLENTTPHFIRCIKPNGKHLSGKYDEELVLQQLRCCGILEVVRISRSGYPTRMTHQEFAGRYGFLLSDKDVPKDPLSMSVAVLQQFNTPPQMYQVGFTKVFLRAGQIGELESKRKQALQSIIGVQKHIRVIRSENARRKYDIMANEQLSAIIYLQSVIRGCLIRKHFNDIHNSMNSMPDNTQQKRKHSRKNSDTKDVPQAQVQGLPPIVAELQKRVLKAEATLGKKEQENAALREKVNQFEARWSEYEAKMKSMEEMWQKQMANLQMSPSAAGNSLDSDNNASQPRRADTSISPRDDSDDAYMGFATLWGSTAVKFSNGIPRPASAREAYATSNGINNLVKEFEHQRQIFDDHAKALEKVKMGQCASNMNPDDELQQLKLRFRAWKRDYKVRLKETKARLNNVDKGRRKWWEKLVS